MLVDPKSKEPTKEDREQDVIKYGIRMAGITIMVVFGFMSSCTMMPSFEFVDADAAAVKEAEAKGKVAIAEQEHKQQMAKIAAIKELVEKHKVDPIAARCAVEGWDRTTEDVCKGVVGLKPSGVSVEINTKQDK